MARTIDNLGMDISTRYAHDQIFVDEKLIKDSRAIPLQTQVDVSTSAFLPEFEVLFGLGKLNVTWADFFPPSRYYEQRKRLFTQMLIPALGSLDKKEAQVQRITSLLKKAKQKKEEGEKEGQEQEEEKQEFSEEEKEKKILLTLLNQLIDFDKVLIDINSRRSQYQKG